MYRPVSLELVYEASYVVTQSRKNHDTKSNFGKSFGVERQNRQILI